MEGKVKDLSKYRYQKAEQNLEIAKDLFDREVYGFALNRAYYAAFDAMRAVNALDGFDSSKHSGVISHFNKNHVKNGDFNTDTSGIIKRASMMREKSDYEDFYEPDREDTEEVIKEVAVFLSTVKAFLDEKLSDIDR